MTRHLEIKRLAGTKDLFTINKADSHAYYKGTCSQLSVFQTKDYSLQYLQTLISFNKRGSV